MYTLDTKNGCELLPLHLVLLRLHGGGRVGEHRVQLRANGAAVLGPEQRDASVCETGAPTCGID